MHGQPNIRYFVDLPRDLNFFERLEGLIPGTLVYGRRSYGRKFRLKNAEPDQRQEIVSCEIYTPLHAAWLVEGSLVQSGVSYNFLASGIESITGWSNDPQDLAALKDLGVRRAQELILRGELRSHVADRYAVSVYGCGLGKLSAVDDERMGVRLRQNTGCHHGLPRARWSDPGRLPCEGASRLVESGAGVHVLEAVPREAHIGGTQEGPVIRGVHVRVPARVAASIRNHGLRSIG